MRKEIPIPASEILQELIAEITTLNAGFIIGMYVTGSIPLNDFHPNKSDIDFVILCNELPSATFRSELEQLHKKIDRNFNTTRLNGCYITHSGLNVHNAATTKTLYYREGRMKESIFEMVPITLYELKTTAITLRGIPAEKLPVVVETNDVNKFLFKNINAYWKNWITKNSFFTIHQLQIIFFPRLTEWVVLGIARQFYTLKTGKITSKTKAGLYCLEHLPPEYHLIIQEAVKIRNDKGNHFLSIKNSYYVKPSINRAKETMACAKYIIHLFNEEYKLKT